MPSLFSNWIDLAEPLYLARRLSREPLLRRKAASRLSLGAMARVKSAWTDVDTPAIGWLEIPAVQHRINRMVTGDPELGFCEHLAAKYLAGRTGLKALSLGCGDGTREELWARTGHFERIDALDLSEPRVLAAKQRIRGTPLEDILSYRSADVNRVELPAGAYDLVIFEHALHHFSGLEPLLERVREALRPRGLLVANEFVGPTRFQWSDRQIEAANELLQRFPTRYRTAMLSELPRLPARRPSKLALWMSDPSEAVQSADILPLLRRHFAGLEVTGYGGAILHLLFAGIGHHFVDPDATAARLLEESFEREDALIANGEVAHDFAVAVGAK